jgi:predicted phosphate transport protein (TIGR00153 family)
MAKGFLRKILLPKEDKFFPMFEEMADLIAKSAAILNRIITSPVPSEETDLFAEIKVLENQADDIVHNVLDSVDSSFITPFDREDIQRLISKMDDVIDLINSTSQQIKLYKPKSKMPQVHDLAQIIVRGCEQIRIAVPELRNLKKSDKLQAACLAMNDLENQADDVFHELISTLFQSETNPIELIKRKEILETMEEVTDCVEDVSDVLKTIMIKSA